MVRCLFSLMKWTKIDTWILELIQRGNTILLSNVMESSTNIWRWFVIYCNMLHISYYCSLWKIPCGDERRKAIWQGWTKWPKSLWRHQMEHFPRNWPFVRGIHRSPVNSPHKDQWRGALMFSLICVWINDWVNNREAGDLRRYRAHYDVILMFADYRFKWIFMNEEILNWLKLTQVAMCERAFWRDIIRLVCRYNISFRMMTSSNGIIFPVTGPLWGEFTGHRWNPLTKASDAELWCFLWSALEQTVEQTTETPVIWDPLRPLWSHCNAEIYLCIYTLQHI